MTEIDIEENRKAAQEYKELLRISYQTLTLKTRIDKAFDVSVETKRRKSRSSMEEHNSLLLLAKIVALSRVWCINCRSIIT
jgi:GTP pyrophosphokinase